MHALHERPLRKAAVGACDDTVAANELAEPHQTLSHEFGMLDDIGLMRDHAGNELAAFRQLHPFPHPPFVLVTRVGHLQEVTAGAHFEDEIGNVFELDIVRVRTELPQHT